MYYITIFVSNLSLWINIASPLAYNIPATAKIGPYALKKKKKKPLKITSMKTVTESNNTKPTNLNTIKIWTPLRFFTSLWKYVLVWQYPSSILQAWGNSKASICFELKSQICIFKLCAEGAVHQTMP